MEPQILLDQKILIENVQPSVCALQFKFTWVKQEDNNLKHTSKSTSELLKAASQSPDLIQIDLKQTFIFKKPFNVVKPILQRTVRKAISAPQWHKGVIASYHKYLITVLVTKVGTTAY